VSNRIISAADKHPANIRFKAEHLKQAY